MGDVVEVAREEVLEMLPSLTEQDLEEVTTGLELEIKESKGGKASKKSILLNLLRRHITSEEVENQEDQGMEMFSKLHIDLEARYIKKKREQVELEENWIKKDVEQKMEELKKQVREEVSAEGGGEGGSGLVKQALEEIKNRDSWNRTSNTEGEQQISLLKKMKIEEEEKRRSEDKLLLELLKKRVEYQAPPSLPRTSERLRNSEGLGMDIHKLKIREFKINGTVGGESEIEYSSLVYQVKEGRTLGYSEKEIQLGIVKVVKDKTLKKFLEINTDMTQEDFYGLLRNHYDVKDSTTLLEEMVTSIQEPTENIVNFVMRMMNTRDTILDITKCEDCPLGEPIIQKQFVRSVLVGLRKPTNRIELQPIIERTNLTRLETLKAVKEILKKDEENAKKMGKKSDVKAMDVGLEGLAARRKEDKIVETAILEQVASLTTQVQGLIAAMNLLKEELKEVKRSCACANEGKQDEQKKNGNGNYNGNNFNNNFKFLKCQDCEQKRKFCMHCSKCGSGDHKRRDCEKNE